MRACLIRTKRVLKKISSHFPKRACVKNVTLFLFFPTARYCTSHHHPSSSIVIKPSNHARNIEDTIDDEERD